MLLNRQRHNRSNLSEPGVGYQWRDTISAMQWFYSVLCVHQEEINGLTHSKDTAEPQTETIKLREIWEERGRMGAL
jgi:hypothetical protein